MDKVGPRTEEDVLDLPFDHGVGVADTRGVRAVSSTEVLDSVGQFR